MTLTIRPMRHGDIRTVFALMTDADYAASYAEAYTTDEARWDVLYASYLSTYIVCDAQDVVATVTWSAQDEIGFWVRTDWRNRGVATAALALFVRFYGGHRAYTAACWADNLASQAVLRRAGFLAVGTDTVQDRSVRRYRLETALDAQDGLGYGVDRAGILPVKDGHRGIRGVRFDLEDLAVNLAGS